MVSNLLKSVNYKALLTLFIGGITLFSSGVASAGIKVEGAVRPEVYQTVKKIWNSYPTQGYDIILSNDPKPLAMAIGAVELYPGLYMTPQIQLSQKFVDSVRPDELKFVLAHEMSHLIYNHSAKWMGRLKELQRTPAELSGYTFIPWGLKWDERQADILGQAIYLNAHYSPDVFFKGSSLPQKYSTLDPRDTHFSFEDRFHYLQEGLARWQKSHPDHTS